MTNIYAIIPARGGSKGVPGKNIKLLMNEPLIAYSILASLKSNQINRTIVSTDSEEIAEVALKYGAEVPFFRPSEISGDKSSDYEFFEHAINWFSKSENEVPDLFVHLRPTTPLRNPSLIDDAVNLFLNNIDKMTALRSVHKMSESAYKYFEIKNNILTTVCENSFDLDRSNQARQMFPDTYIPNGYVDIIKSAYVIENKLIHGNSVMPFVTPEAYEVDSHEDFEYLEYLVNKDKSIYNLLFGDK